MHKNSKYRAPALVASVAGVISSKRRTALTLVALTAGALATTPGQALAEEPANIKAMDFTTQDVYNQVVNVTSTDRVKWNKIEPGEVNFGAHVMIDTRTYVFAHGWVKAVGIVLGTCGGSACLGKPLLWADNPNTKDYENQMAVKFPTSKIPVSSAGGIATVPNGDDIIAKCNGHGAPGAEHSFDYLMPATFVADTVMAMSSPNTTGTGGGLSAIWVGDGDHSLTRSFRFKVVCKPFELRTSGTTVDPNPDPHRTKVTATNIELFLATLVQPASAGRGPSGTQCKPIKVTTRIETDKAGPKNVKLWRQVNNGPITSESKQMHATALAGGKFGDDWVKWENFTKTTTVQYKAEVLGGTFAPSTPWKSITVHCNGNFASPTSDANPDNGKPKPQPPTIVTPPPRVTCVGGKVAGGTCACPRAHTVVKTSSAAFRCVKVAVAPERPIVSLRQPHARPAYLVGPNRPAGMRPGAPFARGRLSGMPPSSMYFR
jgi:hypothetical protein